MGNRAYWKSLEGGPKDPLAKAEMRELADPTNKGKYVAEGFKILGDAAATAGTVIGGPIGLGASVYKALGPSPNKWWEYDKEGKLNTFGKMARVAEAAPMVIGLGSTIANAAKSVPVLQRAGQATGREVRRAADMAAREGRRALESAKQRLTVAGRDIQTGMRTVAERIPRVQAGVPPSQRLGSGIGKLVRDRQIRSAAQQYIDEANRAAMAETRRVLSAGQPTNFMGPNPDYTRNIAALGNLGVL